MSDRMTGAEAVVAQLVAEGTDVVLSIPGEHNLPICNALLDHTHIRFITGRHEQGITFMANGYARASGRIAVPICIGGPGVTNSLTPLADAYLDSVPMVLVAMQGDPARLGTGTFHELKDQTGVLASVAKWNTLVERVRDIPEAIRTAFREAYSGRPGPAAVEECAFDYFWQNHEASYNVLFGDGSVKTFSDAGRSMYKDFVRLQIASPPYTQYDKAVMYRIYFDPLYAQD